MRGFQNIFEIVGPFLLVVIAFVLIMGMFVSGQISIERTFINFKVASLITHTLTGSSGCLNYEYPDGSIRKGILALDKVEDFGTGGGLSDKDDYEQPVCARTACWRWRAIVTDLEEEEIYTFGDDADNDDIWDGSYAEEKSEFYEEMEIVEIIVSGQLPLKVYDELAGENTTVTFSGDVADLIWENYPAATGSIDMPVVLYDPSEDEYRLGVILVEVAPKSRSQCNEDIQRTLDQYCEENGDDDKDNCEDDKFVLG